MPTKIDVIDPRHLDRLSMLLGLYALIGGAITFAGWVFDVPRLTDWLDDDVSTQPLTAILISLTGAAVLCIQKGHRRTGLALGGFVALIGSLNVLQYLMNVDFGYSHQLLFGRDWGRGATYTPGRFGLPASISFILIGSSLVVLGNDSGTWRRHVPGIALVVVLLMMFSLLGYMFDAHNFYAIPWLSAIALPTATMLLALAVSLIINVPEHQPTLLLIERSSAGAMARTVLPILIAMIPLAILLRVKGYELELFDVGTSRAVSAAVLILGVVGLMWVALLALRRREQRERETDRRKDEFLATLAHELRNPLAPISNATSLLKLAHSDRDIFDRATDTIERQLAHMVRLIDDLLDKSRITQGKLELRCERIELASVIDQAVETCRPMSACANQEIIVNLPPQPIYLYADPVRLSQIVSNLLNNSCKFTRQDGKINLTVERRNNDAAIIVRDEGIGIPPDRLSAVFDMFTQVDQSLERSKGGLGIGLTLAKRLVELHGGSIQARSEGLGKGSEFIIRVPINVDQAPIPIKESATQSGPNASRILIVDDNVDGAESLAKVFKLSGSETFLAHDGEQAVEAAERQRPDVILLDIGLPKLNGFDACQRIRANPWGKNVLIIALTGWGQEEDRRKSAAAGFDGHLVKPVDLTELMKLMANPRRAGG